MENRYFLRCAGQNIEERDPPIPNPKSQSSIDTHHIAQLHPVIKLWCSTALASSGKSFGTMYIVRNPSGLNGVKGSKLFQPNRARPICVRRRRSLSSPPFIPSPHARTRRSLEKVSELCSYDLDLVWDPTDSTRALMYTTDEKG